jgi:basic membrane protein A
VDTAVFDTIKLAKEGKFKGEVTEWGFAEGGIDYALDEHNRSLITPEMEKKINEIKQAIQEHKIKVPDYYIESERT